MKLTDEQWCEIEAIHETVLYTGKPAFQHNVNWSFYNNLVDLGLIEMGPHTKFGRDFKAITLTQAGLFALAKRSETSKNIVTSLIIPEQLEYTNIYEPHDEQVRVWGVEVAEALESWIKDFDSYDDKIAFFKTLETKIKSISMDAHAAGMDRVREKPKREPDAIA